MRTSFQHQSEAQSPNGPLTAATSPDTPSASPTTQSCTNPEFPVSAEHSRFSRTLGPANGPFAVSAGNKDRSEADCGLSSLTSEIRFLVRSEGPARDSVRFRYPLFVRLQGALAFIVVDAGITGGARSKRFSGELVLG